MSHQPVCPVKQTLDNATCENSEDTTRLTSAPQEPLQLPLPTWDKVTTGHHSATHQQDTQTH